MAAPSNSDRINDRYDYKLGRKWVPDFAVFEFALPCNPSAKMIDYI
jgi:hypothetical protein